MKKIHPYFNMNYKTPDDLKNIYAGKKFLIISNGPSTSNLIKYKPLLNKKFDVVMSLNRAVIDFEKEMDIYLGVERHLDRYTGAITYVNGRKEKYNKKIKHFVYYREIDNFRNDIEKYKITRNNFNFKPNIREYKANGEEGLLTGPKTPQGLSAGSVSAQAIHLAAILGASEIYLIGCDFLFKDDKADHYYNDNLFYRNDKSRKANLVVDVDFNGKKYKSIEFFVYSAKFIDKLVKEDCKNAGIKVYDFSDGLLSAPIKLDINKFFI